MKKLKNIFSQIIKDESGQGASEYILMLVVIVGIAMIFRDRITEIVRSKVEQLAGDIGGFTSQ